jgi:glycosyltransferase involved in cell wall biosynthesis
VSAAEPLRLIALPRDSNPYQESLYGEMRRLGAEVRYAGDLTPSHTLNLLLLPFELAAARLRGWRVLHVHWVFGFKLPGAGRFPLLRRLAQRWFEAILALTPALGIRVVWTLHNVLPHEPVFHDDVAARRALVGASDLVIAHSRSALEQLRETVGVAPRDEVVVPHGPPVRLPAAEKLPPPGTRGRPRTFLFAGKIFEYKGVEDLIAAFAALSPRHDVRLVVAGACPDGALRERLRRAAAPLGDRVDLRLGYVPDGERAGLFAEADAVVLPFRRVTTSGSALEAMSHARAVVLPGLPAFDELPDDAVIRYDDSPAALRAALEWLAQCPAGELERVASEAAAYASTLSWSDSARQTAEAVTRCAA